MTHGEGAACESAETRRLGQAGDSYWVSGVRGSLSTCELCGEPATHAIVMGIGEHGLRACYACSQMSLLQLENKLHELGRR